MSLRQKLLTAVSKQFPTLKRLKDAKDGIAAIEFAFIAPIMIALYFGMSEVAMGIMADRQVSHATSVTGDLTTQLPAMNGAELADVMTATIAVMGVKSNNLHRLTIELNSFQMNIDGSVNRVGYARLGPEISAGGPAVYDPSGLNSQMFNSDSGVVVARINYQYQPTTMMFLNQFTMAETFVMKPRKSVSVPFDDAGMSDFTCIAGSDLKVTCTGTS